MLLVLLPAAFVMIAAGWFRNALVHFLEARAYAPEKLRFRLVMLILSSVCLVAVIAAVILGIVISIQVMQHM